MSSYFLILISHDPGVVLPPKPLPMVDLQGRLLLLLEYRGVDYAAVLGLCSKHMPVLGFGEGDRGQERDRKRRRRRRRGVLSLPAGLAAFHFRLSWWPSGPAQFIPTLCCISCLLSHNNIVNGNNTFAYREVSAATMDEWRHNGKANSSRCHLQVFWGTLLLGRVCRWKIRLILYIAGWMWNLVSNAIFISHPSPFSSFPFSFKLQSQAFFFFSLWGKNLNNLSVFWCLFPPLLYLEGEWREMERRQTGGKADESCFFFHSFFLMGWTWVACWGEQEKGAKDGRREAKGWRGEPSAGEGPKRSLQTFVIPLLLMWSQAQQNAGSQI